MEMPITNLSIWDTLRSNRLIITPLIICPPAAAGTDIRPKQEKQHYHAVATTPKS